MDGRLSLEPGKHCGHTGTQWCSRSCSPGWTDSDGSTHGRRCWQPACVTATGANREHWGAGIAVKHLLLSGFMRGLGAVPACSSVADWTSALSVL